MIRKALLCGGCCFQVRPVPVMPGGAFFCIFVPKNNNMVKADYILRIREGWPCELREADEDQEANLLGVKLYDVSYTEYGIDGYIEREVVPPIRKFGGGWYDAVTQTFGFRFSFEGRQEIERLVDSLGKTINIKIENENTSP